MSVADKQIRNNSFSCVFVVLVLVFSSLASIGLVNKAEASASGNISIVGSFPSEFDYIPAYTATYFTVELTNIHTDISQPRTINWYVCLGEEVTNTCISQRIDDGTIDIPSMAADETGNYTSLDPFNPNGLNQTITVIYQFDEFDTNPTDDVLNFKINSTLQFTDVKINTDEDIINSLTGLANYDGVKILANNTEYNMSFGGRANICSSCNINASIGWQLWDHNKSSMLAEEYEFRVNFPKLSFYRDFEMTLPTFEYPHDGSYVLVYGLFDSSGDPYGDLYNHNNLNHISIVINTELDLYISDIFPSHNPSEPNYLFGQNMVSVKIGNRGNATALAFNVELTVSGINQNAIVQQCEVTILAPEQQRTCNFNMPIHGNSISITATLPTELLGITDSNLGDNTAQKVADSVVSQLSTYISIDNEKDWYTTNEEITVSANVNPYSAGPVNFSWWYSGIINVDYGQQILINTSNYGLGNHNFKLISSDILGNNEIIYFSITVYLETTIENDPFYSASAIISSSTIEIQHDSELPAAFQDYNIGGSKVPLMLYQFDLIDTESNNSTFDGQNYIDVLIDLSHTIPEGVPYSSVEFRKLDSFEDRNWEFFNTQNYGYVNQQVMFAKLYEPTTILIIGDLGPPDIEARNFSVNLISAGNFVLSWDPHGSIDSDYILGWNIHQKVVPEFGGTIFQSPQENYNELLWNDLLTDSFRAFVPISETNWEDLLTVPSGFCSSYAIIPVDRTGKTFNHLANVSMENGISSFICGDSTPPSTSVTDMTITSIFTNDTECFDILKNWNMCYEISISWTWPVAGETNETWNLYRTEQRPNGMDLALLQPILTGMTYSPGDSFQYTISGIDDESIRPMKTFYYILTPTDEYGNERTIALYPSANVKRINIQDQWWQYNQHVIPEPVPEPEPPLGSEWLGNFSDSLEQEEFKIAGIVALSTLCIGFIMLAFIAKRLKRLRRIVAARNKRIAAESMADEFDDFFD